MRSIFPPKDLEKYGAQNTHAPFFFFFKCKALSIFNGNKVYYSLAVLLFYYKQVNKGLIFLVVIFYCLSINTSVSLSKSVYEL